MDTQTLPIATRTLDARDAERIAKTKAAREAEIASMLQGWTFEHKEALGFWLSHACDHAGITDKKQRRALQQELINLIEI